MLRERKREIRWVIDLILMMLYLSALSAQAKYGGGSGEPNDPYLIYTAEQMNAIGAEPNDWDKHFKLMEDVDLRDYSGDEFNIIGEGNYEFLWIEHPFTGIFDGNGKKIFNFNYTSTDTNFVGIFGYIGTWGKEAVIKDLGLINPNVDAGTGNYVGSLIGMLKKGTVTGCYVEGGNIVGENYVGGFVGAYSEGVQRMYPEPPFTISNCYSTSRVEGTLNVGGLVGSNDIGKIIDSYATGNVSGNQNVGGLVGVNGKWGEYSNFPPIPGTIINCYSTGLVSGESYAGGLVGLNIAGVIINCFWDIQTSGQLRSDGGTDKITAEMQTASTFLEAGWDFIDETDNGNDDIWWIDEGNDYPRLWWEQSTDDMLFLMVDDFESYNDLGEEQPDSNRIWNIWIDGFDNPNNGSMVGESMPPFVYFMLAHTGEQSMPYYYDNSGPANYSEATANVANLMAGQDWTKHDIKTLSLWFRRFMEFDPWFHSPENDPVPMYVSLANMNGPTMAVYHDDPNAAQITAWMEWRIDLQEFASQGVDLTNINTISIGFGYKKNPHPGGSGKMYFDDIRLSRSAP